MPVTSPRPLRPAHTPASAPRLSTPLRQARAAKGWSAMYAVQTMSRVATSWGWQLCSPESLKRQLTRWESGAGRPDASYRALLAHIYETNENALGLAPAPVVGVDVYGDAAPHETEVRAVLTITLHLSFFELLGLYLFHPEAGMYVEDDDPTWVGHALRPMLTTCTTDDLPDWSRRARAALADPADHDNEVARLLAPMVIREFGVSPTA